MSINDASLRHVIEIMQFSSAQCQTIATTNSCIPLTDLPREAILLLERDHDLKTRRGASPSVSTFGLDPSEAIIRLLNQPDSMSDRALQWLDNQLERQWTQEDIPELEGLVDVVGAGFHRCELRAILKQLNT